MFDHFRYAKIFGLILSDVYLENNYVKIFLSRFLLKMKRHFFDQWLLLHILVGAGAHYVGLSHTTYLVTHISYEILSNTDKGMKLVNRLPFWPPKKEKDEMVNFVGDPFWGWIGWTIANNS